MPFPESKMAMHDQTLGQTPICTRKGEKCKQLPPSSRVKWTLYSVMFAETPGLRCKYARKSNAAFK